MFVGMIVVVMVASMLLTISAFRSPIGGLKFSRINERKTTIMMARSNDHNTDGNPRNWPEFVAYMAEVMIGGAFLIALHNGQITLPAANAEIDYFGIIYLGGGDKIDINNANIRAYLKVS